MKKILLVLILIASLGSVYAYEKNVYKEELKERGWLYGCNPANMSLTEPVRGGFNWAVMHGETEIMDLEVKAGLDITQCGKNLPNMATWKNQPEALDFLLKNGFNPNEIHIDHSYLTFAIFRKNPEAVKVLIDNGADVNLVAKGKYPLNSAIKKKQPEIVEMLLKAGAKPNDETTKLIAKTKNEEIKNLFENKNTTVATQKVTVSQNTVTTSINPKIKALRDIMLLEVTNLSYPDSAGGHACTVNIYNTSDKDIKYVTLSLTYYNTVDDPMYDDIRDTPSFLLQYTGVLKAKYETHVFWDNVMYNNQLVNSAKVNSIKIDYMDGSKYEFKKEDIEHVVKYARVIGYIENEHPIKYVNKLLQNW